MNTPGPQVYEFGDFRLDTAERTLVRKGETLALPPKVFDTLVVFVENSGHLINKDEFMQELWPDTFVEEVALAQNISQLRRALGTDTIGQRLIETVPKRAYRFVARVKVVGGRASSTGAEETQPLGGAEPLPARALETAPGTEAPEASWTKKHPERRKGEGVKRRVGKLLLAGGALAAGAAIVSGLWLRPTAGPRITRITRLTFSQRVEPWGKLVSDGARVYFLEREGGHWNLMQTPVRGGVAEPFPGPSRNLRILAISPDHSEFLVGHFERRDSEMALWLMPSVGGQERRLGEAVGGDAAWSPDGTEIAYTAGSELWVIHRDGTNARRLATANGRASMPAWSPDGRLIRLDVEDAVHSPPLWEVQRDSGRMRRVLGSFSGSRSACCGAWMPDGRYFLFQALQAGHAGLWARREAAGLLSRGAGPVLLSNDENAFADVLPSGDGARVFVVGTPSARRDVLVFEPEAKRFLPLLPSLRPLAAQVSPDQQWIFFLDRSSPQVWRSRADGSERTQLTPNDLAVTNLALSPDGRRAALVGQRQGQQQRVYVIPSEGGAPEDIGSPEGELDDPSWAPDSAGLLVARGNSMDAHNARNGIYQIDLASHSATKVPGSDGLRNPRWSPDKGHMAAVTRDEQRVMLLDAGSGEWRAVGEGHLMSEPQWSRDGRWLYFQDLLAEGQPIYRLGLSDGRKELFLSFEEQLRENAMRCGLSGMTPSGGLIITIDRSGSDIYALDLELP